MLDLLSFKLVMLALAALFFSFMLSAFLHEPKSGGPLFDRHLKVCLCGIMATLFAMLTVFVVLI